MINKKKLLTEKGIFQHFHITGKDLRNTCFFF